MPNKAISHAFRDADLLTQALTHRSAGQPHNERLEFLGDAIVNLLAAEALYAAWPKADEGTLTRARTELVRESALAGIARTLELGQLLTLDRATVSRYLNRLSDAGRVEKLSGRPVRYRLWAGGTAAPVRAWRIGR